MKTRTMLGLPQVETMVRIKVDLTEKQRAVVERLAARNGVSMSEVVRRAVDQMIEGAWSASEPRLQDVPPRDAEDRCPE